MGLCEQQKCLLFWLWLVVKVSVSQGMHELVWAEVFYFLFLKKNLLYVVKNVGWCSHVTCLHLHRECCAVCLFWEQISLGDF